MLPPTASRRARSDNNGSDGNGTNPADDPDTKQGRFFRRLKTHLEKDLGESYKPSIASYIDTLKNFNQVDNDLIPEEQKLLRDLFPSSNQQQQQRQQQQQQNSVNDSEDSVLNSSSNAYSSSNSPNTTRNSNGSMMMMMSQEGGSSGNEARFARLLESQAEERRQLEEKHEKERQQFLDEIEE